MSVAPQNCSIGPVAPPCRQIDAQDSDRGARGEERGDRIVRCEHEDGHACFSGIERVKHAQAFHRTKEEIGGLGREVGHGQRHVGQCHDEL